ncbi:TPA: hypothetical protein LVL69_005511 [Klebsiella oxytoca]|nr:hypothetical protein [Klebsiella oxytoca]HBM3050978.1 hypothetical protein [Klebsiella oxytoca]
MSAQSAIGNVLCRPSSLIPVLSYPETISELFSETFDFAPPISIASAPLCTFTLLLAEIERSTHTVNVNGADIVARCKSHGNVDLCLEITCQPLSQQATE